MNNFQIEIPNTKAVSYKVVTVIVLLMNTLVFGYLAWNAATGQSSTICIIGLCVNVFALTAIFSVKYLKELDAVRAEIIFVISALLWFVLGKYLLAILLVLFALMGVFTNRKIRVIFNDAGILYPSFPSKLFLWPDVSQAILKDDVLTIDLKNNQLLQFTLAASATAGIDLDRFNAFCSERIAQA